MMSEEPLNCINWELHRETGHVAKCYPPAPPSREAEIATDCIDGWRCEAHPHLGWPHGECLGPGIVCACGAALRPKAATRQTVGSPTTAASRSDRVVPSGADSGHLREAEIAARQREIMKIVERYVYAVPQMAGIAAPLAGAIEGALRNAEAPLLAELQQVRQEVERLRPMAERYLDIKEGR